MFCHYASPQGAIVKLKRARPNEAADLIGGGTNSKDAPNFASMQQPADFFCKEILPEHHRLVAPFPLLA
jgi:hypothetical protein